MGTNLKLVVQSPTRIDLSGGTYDIWPLYLFLPEPAQTINLGINLFSRAELRATHLPSGKTGEVTLRSRDQRQELKAKFEELDQLEVEPGLILHLLLLRQFVRRLPLSVLKNTSLELETSAQSPAGAGLGGSSSLAVSIVGALRNWAAWIETGAPLLNWKDEAESLVDLVKDVETRVIQVPAGLQDYYGAMFGGLQRLSWLPSRRVQEFFPESILSPLSQRLILFYSGHSRNSGINNWVLFKNFIDGKEPVREQFLQLAQATHALDHALMKEDWKNVGLAIQDEWETRRNLAPGITTPEIDEAIQIGSQNGSTAAKICGAGGGGCFFLYLPDGDPIRRSEIVKKVRESCPSIRELPFQPVIGGSQLKVDA